MKSKMVIYVFGLMFFSFITSCVSYEATSSYKKSKHPHSKRYTYNSNKSNKHISKSKPSHKSPHISKPIKKDSNLESKKYGVHKNIKSTDVVLVLKEAEKYKGTPYKYGGNTFSGIDCSGLVCNAYQRIDVKLPRRSIDMSNAGKDVSISRIKEGDLLFFNTGGSSINHVGIVYNISGSGEITFIHASTSKGVIISSLEETYWKNKFKKAQRIL
ncbi:C40 family peptidase [Apibacter mensalis]|uniref:C40 family peptidase n=1 Tax=Apibacter mensalis TaxID=1586267 RepID=UPI0026EEBE4E|nr:C40 family peptidase [Apibacter mensalis]